MDGIGGVSGVLARIAMIESRFASARAGALPPMPGPPALAAPQDDGAATFSEALGRALDAQDTPGAIATTAQTSSAVAGLSLGALAGQSAPVAAGADRPPASASAGARAVALAKEHLGVPYVWGGESLAEGGFDCSGLIQHTFARLGVDLPRVSRDQARAGSSVANLAEARPGDLVAFGSPVDHIGIYAGDNKMVVAPHTGAVVRVQEITRPVVAIRRVI